VTGGNAENHYKPSDLTTDLTTSPKSLGPSLKSFAPSRKSPKWRLESDSSLKSLTLVLSAVGWSLAVKAAKCGPSHRSLALVSKAVIIYINLKNLSVYKCC
jgi:hypothetical protein